MNKFTYWNCDVCVSLSPSKSQLYNSKIDQILEIVNATNSKINFLIEENKLLRDNVSTLENKIKHLETISSTKDIPGPITINELYARLSRYENLIIFSVPNSQNQTNNEKYVKKKFSNIGVNSEPTVKTIIN